MFYILLNACSFLLIYILCAWLIYFIFKKPAIIDVFWSLGIFMLGLMYAFLGTAPNERKLIVLVPLGIWAVRLAFYMLLRVIKNREDKRYTRLSQSWKNKHLGFLANFYLQAVLMLIISLPIYYIVNATSQNYLIDMIAFIMLFVAITGEVKADITLYSYKKERPDSICREGLWATSRHPNYFFEFCLWAIFALWACGYSRYGAISLISPLTVLIIVKYITGPLTEALSIEKYGDRYIAYQKEVNMLIPKIKQRKS